ncbi:hypothetical protein [Microcystis aeruginosa]|uniref:Uncharacterized protein n=1 Tax=Microcystis aeruginosa (strain NIES-843 / IAM M-2473) TaxID=449447 RepID=B0JHF3_MICAN|nr:hypothetical protein [Microcystis aeruginosa]BAG02305.1 unknown protein [Microcystis aeruginosa NIES-843]
MKWCVRSVFITLGLVLPSLILDSNRETNKAWAGDFDVLELVQQTQPSDRFLPPESEPIQPLPEERKPVITPTETQPSPPLEPTFRTLSVTTSQKRKGRESKYLSRGVSWRQAAGN